MAVLFVAQLWKQINGKLENKNGPWMYMEETWILPNENTTNEDQVGELVRKTILKKKQQEYSKLTFFKIHNNGN